MKILVIGRTGDAAEPATILRLESSAIAAANGRSGIEQARETPTLSCAT
jgi:hypothetical protein